MSPRSIPCANPKRAALLAKLWTLASECDDAGEPYLFALLSTVHRFSQLYMERPLLSLVSPWSIKLIELKRNTFSWFDLWELSEIKCPPQLKNLRRLYWLDHN